MVNPANIVEGDNTLNLEFMLINKNSCRSLEEFTLYRERLKHAKSCGRGPYASVIVQTIRAVYRLQQGNMR
jgi:hypothetical protein